MKETIVYDRTSDVLRFIALNTDMLPLGKFLLIHNEEPLFVDRKQGCVVVLCFTAEMHEQLQTELENAIATGSIKLFAAKNLGREQANLFACLQILSWVFEEAELGSGRHICEVLLDAKRIEKARYYLNAYFCKGQPDSKGEGDAEEQQKEDSE